MTLPWGEDGIRALALLRVTVFGVWCGSIALNDLTVFARLPAELFQPAGPLSWLPSAALPTLQDAAALRALQIAACVLAALAAIGARPWRAVVLAATIAVTLRALLVESFGHVSHTQVQLVLASWVLAAAPAPRQGASRHCDLAMGTTAALLVLSYTCSASYRVAHHPIATLAGESLVNMAIGQSSNGSSALVAALVQEPWLGVFFKAGMLAATLVELAAPWALLSGRFRRFFVPFILLFHAGSTLLLSVYFWKQALLVLVVLTPISRGLAPARS